MSGEQLKKILGKTGKSYVEIAALLGISSQSLYQMFKADDIKSGMIEKLCNVLNEDVTLFYGGGDRVSAADHSIAIQGNGNNASDTGAFITLLTKKDEQIDRLLGIIEQMNK